MSVIPFAHTRFLHTAAGAVPVGDPVADPVANPAPRGAAPTVLTLDAVDRLAVLNNAVRQLRALGARIVETRIDGPWPSVDGTPLIRIARDPHASFARVLDALGPRTWLQLHRGAVSQAAAQYLGTTVVWEERQ